MMIANSLVSILLTGLLAGATLQSPNNTNRKSSAPPDDGQRTTAAPQKPDPVDASAQLQVVKLSYANSLDAMRAVAAIVRPLNATADERTNSVILQGSEQNLVRALEIIKALDVPAGEGRATTELGILMLRNRNAMDIAQHLTHVFSGRRDAVGIRVAGDPTTNAVIVDASRECLGRARDLVKQLDTPQQSIRLEFAMLHATLNEPQPGAEDQLSDYTSPMPDDLADVAKELARFGKVRLLGRLSTTSSEAQKFSVEGSIGRTVTLEIDGKLIDASAGTVRLEVNAVMSHHQDWFGQASTQPTRMAMPMFKLRTSLTVPRSDTVVLGTAPSGWKAGESAILVVRIGPPAEGKHPANK